MGRGSVLRVEELRPSSPASSGRASGAAEAETSLPLCTAGAGSLGLPGLAGSGAGPGLTRGRKWPWAPVGMGRPPRGCFLPGNILPGQQGGRGIQSGRQEGRGLSTPSAGSQGVPGGNDLTEACASGSGRLAGHPTPALEVPAPGAYPSVARSAHPQFPMWTVT